MKGGIVMPNDAMLGMASEMLSEGHPVVMMTKGNSMLPFIVGDRDSVELFRADSYGPYDIVLAEVAPGSYVLHRILMLEGSAVTLKGDGNLRGVEKCELSDIKGKVSRIIGPSGRETDCSTVRFYRKSRRWRLAPYIVRRVMLAVYRRMI